MRAVAKSSVLVIVVGKGLGRYWAHGYQPCTGSSLQSFLAALRRGQRFPLSVGVETEAQTGSGLSLMVSLLEERWLRLWGALLDGQVGSRGGRGSPPESSLGPFPSFLPHQKSAANTGQPLGGPKCFDCKPLGPASITMRALGDQSHALPLSLERVGTEA